MKKFLIAFLTIFTLVVGFLTWKFLSYSHGKLELHQEASFYILYPDKVEAFQLDNGKPELLATQKMESDQYFGMGENHILHNRYLVYSNDGIKSLGENIVSIDFETGKITRQPSKYYSYITGADSHFLYTATSFRGITAFDSKAKQVKQATLPENFLIEPALITSDDEPLFINGFEYTIGQPDKTRKNMLYVLDKDQLAVQEKIPYDNSAITSSGKLVDGVIYLPVRTYAPSADEEQPSYDLLTYDIQDKKWDELALTKPSPITIHAAYSDRYLLIEHDSGEEKEIRLTVLDLATGNQAFFAHPVLSSYYYSISDVRFLDEETLLIIYGDQLLIYNWKTAETLSQTILSSEYISGIWIQDQ